MFLIKSKFDPQGKQRQKLVEIGEHLRKVRHEQDISIETISQTTLIPAHFLEALEAGDLDNLPEPIYIRWLIKQYADTLTLNGEELSRRFPLESQPRLTFPRLSLPLPSFSIRPIHLYFLYLLLVIGSVQAISRVLEQSSLQSNRLPPPSLPEQQTVQTRPNPIRPVATNAPINRQVVVAVNVKDDCWLKIVVDGKTEFEGLLPQGTQRTWQADRALTVRAGNAGGVYVAVNNANAKQLGLPGKVEEVTYRAR